MERMLFLAFVSSFFLKQITCFRREEINEGSQGRCPVVAGKEGPVQEKRPALYGEAFQWKEREGQSERISGNY